MKTLKTLTSRENPQIKLLRSLAHSARERKRHGRTLLDGTHLVQAALDACWPLRSLFVSEQGLGNAEVRALVECCPGLPITCLTNSLFAYVSPVDTPSGLLALIDLPEAPQAGPFLNSLLVLDGVQDPGNLGAILRTGAAAGITDVLLAPGCTQAWSPRALRAGMGGHFALRIHEGADVVSLLQEYRGLILATGLQPGSNSLYEHDLRGAVAWLFGAEGSGLSAEVRALATATVRIPMSGATESLNVGAAVAICLFEQLRQKGAPETR